MIYEFNHIKLKFQIFIQYKIPGHFSYFLKPFIQVVVLTLGLLVPLIPLSACNDYWPDISCGMLIGFFTAYANVMKYRQ